MPSWKRLFDFFGCLVVGILVSPLLLLLVLFIKSVSKGPAIFTQDRLGRGGKTFRIWKFRTMCLAANADREHRDYVKSLLSHGEPAAKPRYGSRLIPGGDLIRRWSLDELPQLWNVLAGQMSLIGPRPDVLELEDYQSSFELRRFEVLPGITGLWQVSGKNDLSYNEMIALDVRYVDELSWWLDIKIMVKTFGLIARQGNS